MCVCSCVRAGGEGWGWGGGGRRVSAAAAVWLSSVACMCVCSCVCAGGAGGGGYCAGVECADVCGFGWVRLSRSDCIGVGCVHAVGCRIITTHPDHSHYHRRKVNASNSDLAPAQPPTSAAPPPSSPPPPPAHAPFPRHPLSPSSGPCHQRRRRSYFG
jgi:hypothetical protein